MGSHGYTRRGRLRNRARTIGGCASVGTLAVLVELLNVRWGAGALSVMFSVWHCPSISVLFFGIFLWICGMAREYGCDSGGYGVGRECKGDARTKERANEILYRHTFKFNDGCSRQGVATNTDTHQCLQIGSNYRNIMSLEVLSLLTTSKACQKEEEYRLTGATHLISIRVRIKPVSPK